MTVSFYSFITAMLWFSLFILMGTLLQRRTSFIFCYELVPLLSLLTLTIIRLAAPIETPFTRVIRSTELYPAVRDFLQTNVTVAGGATASVTVILLSVWAGGTLFSCGKLALDIRDSYRMVRRRTNIPHPGAEEILEKLLARRNYRRGVRLITSAENRTPQVIGFFKPVVLLPVEVEELTTAELEHVIDHELTHYFNHDLWVKLLVKLLCCLLWWNPFLLLLRRNLDSALEFKCDLVVTRHMSPTEAQDYLRTILHVAELTREKRERDFSVTAKFCGIAEKYELNRRFQLVLNKPAKNQRRMALAFSVLFLAIFVGSYSFVLQPATFAPQKDIGDEFVITSENSYIFVATNGNRYLVCEGEVLGKVSPEHLKDAPFSSLPVKYESRGNTT